MEGSDTNFQRTMNLTYPPGQSAVIGCVQTVTTRPELSPKLGLKKNTNSCSSVWREGFSSEPGVIFLETNRESGSEH